MHLDDYRALLQQHGLRIAFKRELRTTFELEPSNEVKGRYIGDHSVVITVYKCRPAQGVLDNTFND